MTSKKEEDYQHSNRAGTGPNKRMTGGDLTDDIDINDPCAPHKKEQILPSAIPDQEKRK